MTQEIIPMVFKMTINILIMATLLYLLTVIGCSLATTIKEMRAEHTSSHSWSCFQEILSLIVWLVIIGTSMTVYLFWLFDIPLPIR